jgi:hypothetical protein
MLQYSAVKTFALPFSLPIIDYVLEMTTPKHANAPPVGTSGPRILTIGLHCNFSVQEGPDKPWTSRDWIENEVGLSCSRPGLPCSALKLQ